MATVATDLMTAEQFWEWANRPENAEKFFELERGKVIEMPPPTKAHGFVCGNAARILGGYALQSRRGYICTNDAGVLIERDPDTIRGPDVSFSTDEQTLDTMDRKYSLTLPVLIVEVRSPSDTEKRILRRLEQYMRVRIPMVWLVNPEERIVTVYQPGEIHRTLDEQDELSGNAVLPDFRCRVAEFFNIPSWLAAASGATS